MFLKTFLTKSPALFSDIPMTAVNLLLCFLLWNRVHEDLQNLRHRQTEQNMVSNYWWRDKNKYKAVHCLLQKKELTEHIQWLISCLPGDIWVLTANPPAIYLNLFTDLPNCLDVLLHKARLSKTAAGQRQCVHVRGERILFFGPNTNTNNIRNQNFDRIRIQIIFVFSEWVNTNTNNIRAWIFGRIRIWIIFGFRIVPEYEYE